MMDKLSVRSLRWLLSRQCQGAIAGTQTGTAVGAGAHTQDKKAITQVATPQPPVSGQPVTPTVTTTTTPVWTPSRQEASRKLLPAALFFLTFFTVMAVLLIYMDTTVMRHKQFRLNMSREYEMEGVSQDAAQLVEYIRRFKLESCARPFPPHSNHRGQHRTFDHPQPTPTETKVAQLLNYKRNAIFVEAGAYGVHSGGGSRTEWLEETLSWRGVLLTPDARDYFRLRARRTSQSTLAMHACLSTSTHPKEIAYQESYSNDVVGVLALGSPSEEFTSRVMCFPLYSILLASRTQNADFLSLACGGCELAVMSALPSDKVHISVVEIVGRNKHSLEDLMKSRGYTVAEKTPTSTIYTHHDIPTLKI